MVTDTVDATVSGSGTYHYYIAPGNVHTILMSAGFYDEISNSVKLVDWINGMLEGGAAFENVECDADCEKPFVEACP